MIEPIRYLDVCSGYSAFTQAHEGLGFECAGYAEIDAFPAAMLGHHYGATRPRYMPDPEAEGIEAEERKTRLAMRKSMAALGDAHFGNRIVNFGDFTQIREDDVGPVQLLNGGTPCQAFSVAGKRLGLDDPRGNLTLEFLALARRLRVEWLAWENVPGFLSHDEGRTMGTFLWLLGQLGYGYAYRVLDAQFIRVDGLPWAVPQRRRRLLVVAHLGDAAGPAAVLFDRESLRGSPAPRRETRQGIADPAGGGPDGGRVSGCISSKWAKGSSGPAGDEVANMVAQPITGPLAAAGSTTGGAPGTTVDTADSMLVAEVASTLPAGGNSTGGDRFPGTSAETASSMLIAMPTAATLTRGAESAGKGGYAGRRQEDDVNLVAHSLRAEGFDASEDGSGRGTPLVAVPFDTTQITNPENRSNPQPGDPCHPLSANGHPPAVAFAIHSDALDRSGEAADGSASSRSGLGVQEDVAYALRAKAKGSDAVAFSISQNSNGFAWEGEVAAALQTKMQSATSNQFDGVRDGWAVRRLTPLECERLMGVADGFTLIPYRGRLAADGPRYKVLGNSQARNFMRWLAHGLADAMRAPRG